MKKILIEDYNYPLTDERIAKYPLAERDHSKLLLYQNGDISEDIFSNIGDHLSPDTLLVYNNTRVIQARLIFHKQSAVGEGELQGARIEVFCLEPLLPHDYQLNLSSPAPVVWKCLVGNLKKWKQGSLKMLVSMPDGKGVTLTAERLSTMGNTHEVRFAWSDPQLSFAEIIDAAGELPIPPYLNRRTEESDKTTYQTVYSRIKGSVAAPTAGLHFTQKVLTDLRQRGIHTTELTLHVGAGTFQPVKTADANEHLMHNEIIVVPRQTIADLIDNLGHICAVGTTSMRTLESLYYIGLHPENPFVEQFEPYSQSYTTSTADALRNLLRHLDETHQEQLYAETRIMIEPGFQFRLVDRLITNFHQPKSTLLLLVSAFVGDDWRAIYDYALTHDFRFLSYGDSSLLYRNTNI